MKLQEQETLLLVEQSYGSIRLENKKHTKHTQHTENRAREKEREGEREREREINFLTHSITNNIYKIGSTYEFITNHIAD